ncbi:MAG: LytTR family transcriptional regulator, partial [Algicola sp.]|nr:LytTR family transcriptional regulator [Algicola sp.]
MHPLFEKHQRFWIVFYWLTSGTISASVNSLSVISDYARRELVIPWWQPVVWEFSSQLSILLLIPLIVLADRKWSFSFTRFKVGVAQHLLFSLLFSLSHVFLMVAMRHGSYWLGDATYNFGHWSAELLYEYRKDFFGYFGILATIYVYRFIVSRLRSEATMIDVGEEAVQPAFVERLLVKKLGKEFIINTADIEWVEASGNYMNLHLGERCYPLRETMGGLVKRLDPQHFARTHRSFLVRLDQ